ncbi:MAG: exodeoxyribonuclease VII small subunit [Methylophilaceae bacterium]|nr:exodeoxyribonuclease VII small subunit [Methylophilaceae bacterium]MBL6728949.1 exodeoxyribonuclease VII small subunit [Methylophilaceae bacterium]MBL6790935.1 exodeoxyribonuclease VII small subunit [Methylophilaceae bacterium]
MTKEKINIEGLLEELEAIIEIMEDDNLNIEKSLSSYERGIGLVKEAQKKLTEIEKKVQILSKDDQLENFDPDD